MANIKKKVVEDKSISAVEAVELLKKACQEKQRKFVENVDIAVNLTIDPKQSNQNIRGSVSLPAGTGKNVKVIAFTDDEVLQKEALEAGATKAALEDLIAEVEGGFLDFDYVVATPDAMKSLSKIAKKLGPRGLMPNPKNGNVTNSVAEATKQALKGKVNYKNDKFGIVHTIVGKINFSNEDLMKNIKAVVTAVKDSKPEVIKGKYIKSVFLTTTMGPSVGIDITNFGE